MALSYIERLSQLSKLNASLSQANDKPVFTDDYVLSGLLSKYKLCFDLSWKLMKDIMVDAWAIDDFPKGSPCEVISRAFYNGLIKDDEIWLAMLRLRNELSHIYEVELAKDLARDILERYIPALAAFERDMHEVVAGLPK